MNRHEIAEAERVRCMERLLSHYLPNITFDIQSLRQAADELKTKHRDSESDVLSTKVDANELEDLAIDEEDFTIKALPDNTTRKYRRFPGDRVLSAHQFAATEYSGEFSYLNFSEKIRKKIDEWMKTAAPEVEDSPYFQCNGTSLSNPRRQARKLSHSKIDGEPLSFSLDPL